MGLHRKQRSRGVSRTLALLFAGLLTVALAAPSAALAAEGDTVDQTAASSDDKKAPAPEVDKTTEEAQTSAPKPVVKKTADEPEVTPAAPKPAPKEQTEATPPAPKAALKKASSASEPAPAVQKVAKKSSVAKDNNSEEPDDQEEVTFEMVSVVSNGRCTFSTSSAEGNPSLELVYNDFKQFGDAGQFTINGGQTIVTTPGFKARGGYVYDPNEYDPETGTGYAQEFSLDIDPSNCAPETPEYYIETSNMVRCGEVDITLHNVSPWIYPVSVEVDGVHSYGPVVDNRGDAPDDQTATRTISFDEDSGTHTVRYRVDAGTESDLYRDMPVGEWTELTVQSDCEPNVVINPSATVEVSCDGTGTATLDNTLSNVEHGLEVVVNGVATLYSVPAGESMNVPVSGANPGSNVIVQDDTGSLATATVPEQCDDDTTPPPGDGDDDGGNTTPPTGDDDDDTGGNTTPIVDTKPVKQDTDNGVLPNTGGPSVMTVLAGFVLLASGAVAFVLSGGRRRKTIG